MASEYDVNLKILEYQSTETAEAGTTTTNIKVTGHGLVTGDFIVNTTRRATTQASSERGSRKVTRVDDDNLTVIAMTGQTTSDEIMLFKFVDRVGYLQQSTLSINKRVQGESDSSFQLKVSND